MWPEPEQSRRFQSNRRASLGSVALVASYPSAEQGARGESSNPRGLTALKANSLFPGHEQGTMHMPAVYIRNSGLESTWTVGQNGNLERRSFWWRFSQA
jgi:hypothetical protein